MPDTHEFEAVVEIGVGVIRNIFQASWKDGDVLGEGMIFHGKNDAAGTDSGPSVVSHGRIQLQPDCTGLELAPPENGVRLNLGVVLHLDRMPDTAGFPPLVSIAATVSATVPVGALPGTEKSVGVVFNDFPRSAVSTRLALEDSEGSATVQMIREYLQAQWRDNAIVRTLTARGVNYGYFSADAFMETFNDPDDEVYGIQVTAPTPDHIRISIPIHLRLSNIFADRGLELMSHMGVLTRVAITVPLVSAEARATVTLADAVVTLESLAHPAVHYPEDCGADDGGCLAGAPWDGEAENYLHNLQAGLLYGFNLEHLLERYILSYVRELVAEMAITSIAVPTVEKMETFVGDLVYRALLAHPGIELWRPGENIAITDVRPHVSAGFLAIAINSTNSAAGKRRMVFRRFPGDVAIALSGRVLEKSLGGHLRSVSGRCSFGALPWEFSDMGGYRCTVTALNWVLGNGAIRFTGDVMVYDVFWGGDADCSFWVEIGLRWTDPDDRGRQALEPYLIDQNVDFSWWAGLMAVLGGLVEEILGGVRRVLPEVACRIAGGLGSAAPDGGPYGNGAGTAKWIFHGEVKLDSGGLLVTGDVPASSVHQSAWFGPTVPGHGLSL